MSAACCRYTTPQRTCMVLKVAVSTENETLTNLSHKLFTTTVNSEISDRALLSLRIEVVKLQAAWISFTTHSTTHLCFIPLDVLALTRTPVLDGLNTLILVTLMPLFGIGTLLGFVAVRHVSY